MTSTKLGVGRVVVGASGTLYWVGVPTKPEDLMLRWSEEVQGPTRHEERRDETGRVFSAFFPGRIQRLTFTVQSHLLLSAKQAEKEGLYLRGAEVAALVEVMVQTA